MKGHTMKVQLLGLYLKLQDLLESEAAQDIVEYSMVVAMIAFGATAAMQSVDVAILQVFNNVSSTINSVLTSAS
jgi:pilus assembly protein Flp/PilA